MNQPTLREKLKSATADLHVSLEKTSLAHALTNGTIELKAYGEYLYCLSALHHDIETVVLEINEWGNFGIDIVHHLRHQLLNEDLNALEFKTVYPRPIPPFEIAIDFPAAIGIMYVLEGSTMGGRYLAQRLTYLTGVDAMPATRYFQAYGDQTMARWQEYCLFLDRYGVQHPEMEEQVVDAACYLFRYLEELMHELD